MTPLGKRISYYIENKKGLSQEKVTEHIVSADGLLQNGKMITPGQMQIIYYSYLLYLRFH